MFHFITGASVQVVKSAVVDPNGYSKVVIAGSAPDVYLATQMIQEVGQSDDLHIQDEWSSIYHLFANSIINSIIHSLNLAGRFKPCFSFFALDNTSDLPVLLDSIPVHG